MTGMIPESIANGIVFGPCCTRDHVVAALPGPGFSESSGLAASPLPHWPGEGLILVPTVKHWNAFRPRLIAEGVDVEAAQNADSYDRRR